MAPSNYKRRSSAAVQLTDCALCSASSRCWGKAAPTDSGFLVKRRDVLEKGTVLFRQGERFSAAHIVVSGCLKLCETNESGNERVMAIRLPGELVGMEGWARGHYPYSAIAAAPTKLCELQWPHARECQHSPALLQVLLQRTAIQLDRSTRIWMNLPAIERVAAFLDHFLQHAQPPIELPLTRAEIGSMLGLAEETVVRAMAQLRARKRLNVQGRRIAYVVHNAQECAARSS